MLKNKIPLEMNFFFSKATLIKTEKKSIDFFIAMLKYFSFGKHNQLIFFHAFNYYDLINMYGSTLDVSGLIFLYSLYEETFSITQKLPEKNQSL